MRNAESWSGRLEVLAAREDAEDAEEMSGGFPDGS